MKIQCKKCSATYTLDNSKITEHDVRIKCGKCKEIIIVPGKSLSEDNNIICPKCSYKQKSSHECSNCGLIFAKYFKKEKNKCPLPSISTNSYFTHQHGQISWRELKQKAEDGQIKTGDKIFIGRTSKWVEAQEIRQLLSLPNDTFQTILSSDDTYQKVLSPEEEALYCAESIDLVPYLQVLKGYIQKKLILLLTNQSIILCSVEQDPPYYEKYDFDKITHISLTSELWILNFYIHFKQKECKNRKISFQGDANHIVKNTIAPTATLLIQKHRENTIKITDCKCCGKTVSLTAPTCPHCGEIEPGSLVYCPQCGSRNITKGNKGFSLAKAVTGTIVVGPIGILAGMHGRKNVELRCLTCNLKWDSDGT